MKIKVVETRTIEFDMNVDYDLEALNRVQFAYRQGWLDGELASGERDATATVINGDRKISCELGEQHG